jgi:putative endonuclease
MSTEIGRRAEQHAALHLQSLGYRITGRNVRVGALEVDLLAETDEVIAVVEVRHRSARSFASGLASLASIKKHRLLLAADRIYRDRYKHDPLERRFRIDVCIVHFEGTEVRVEHFPAAITG